MQWLQSMFGGQSAGMTLLLLVLGLALALVLLFWVFRKIAGNGQMRAGRNRQPRLSVTDAAAVDDKRRLVLVRRDDVEHLVMIGGASDILIEANITMTQTSVPAAQHEVHEAAVQAAKTEKASVTKAEPTPIAPAAIISASAEPARAAETVSQQHAPPAMATVEGMRERAAATESHSSAAPADLEKQASANLIGAQQEAAVHKFPGAHSQETSIARHSEPAVRLQESSLESELQRELANGSAEQHSVDPNQADDEPRMAPSVNVTGRSSPEEERKPKASTASGNKEVEDEMQKLLDELANT